MSNSTSQKKNQPRSSQDSYSSSFSGSSSGSSYGSSSSSSVSSILPNSMSSSSISASRNNQLVSSRIRNSKPSFNPLNDHKFIIDLYKLDQNKMGANSFFKENLMVFKEIYNLTRMNKINIKHLTNQQLSALIIYFYKISK
jgi:exo-beta-1,3-glucanase (GH17 family)